MRRTLDSESISRRRQAGVALLLLATVCAAGAQPAHGGAEVVHAFIDPEGLAGLYRVRDDGIPVMPLPQFRLFDAEGRPLWSFAGLPRGFKHELERRMEEPDTSVEGLTFEQEARYFLRRGGLPLNLTTLPATEFTIVEYWTGAG